MGIPTFEYLLYSEEGAVGVLTINRPEQMNAMSRDVCAEIMRFLDYADSADHLKAVIITGAGEKSFVAGADIKNMTTSTPVTSMKGALRTLTNRIENSNKVFIAAVNGYAFGGGFELAMACDIRIVSENAVMGLPEATLGIVPGAGGTQRLVRLAGVGVAKDVILGGRNIRPQEAVTLGIAMKVSAPDKLLEDAMKVAKRVAERAPLAIEVAKKLINAAPSTDIATGMLMENYGVSVLFGTQDKNEGVDAFINKRTPEYKGL